MKIIDNNSYKLPCGNISISFSGGRTSAYMLHNILEANGNLPKNCKVLFQNTGREMYQTLEFVEKCSDRWGVNVTWLEYARLKDKTSFKIVDIHTASTNGEPFDQLIKHKRVLPNPTMRYCTVELKINTAKRYLKSLGWKQWLNGVGIRADEPHRFSKKTVKDCWKPWRPMVNAEHTLQDVESFWARQSFDLELPKLKNKALYGNCDGCFLKSEAQLATLKREYPDRFNWWQNYENQYAHRGDLGYFRKDRPLSELAYFVENQGDWIFDNEAILCQANAGDCTG
tara:strand:+ start:2124 stop:2975 length:852 start_codon:yes stop_codon:yes gene_type:complete